MSKLRREVGGRPWQRQAASLTWMTVVALLALAMTLGVYVAGARCQRASHGVPTSAAP